MSEDRTKADAKGAAEESAQEERRNPLAMDGLKNQRAVRTISRPLRISLAIGAVIAALGLVWLAIFVLVPEPEPIPEYTYVDKNLISGKTRDDVDEVIIQREDGVLTILRDDEGNYFAREAPHARLDQTKASDIFYAAYALSYNDLVEENPTNLAQYGLDRPQSHIICKFKDGDRREYYLGDALTAGSIYYLQVAGEPTVYTVWVNMGTAFSRTLNALRETVLPAPDIDNLRYVLIERKGQDPMEIFWDDNKGRSTLAIWKLKQPYLSDAEWETTDAYTREVSKITVRDFVAETDDPAVLKQYGLDEPNARVVVTDVEGVSFDLLIGSDINNYQTYVMQSGTNIVFTVDKGNLAFLSKKPIELVYRFPHIIRIDVIDGFTISLSDGETYRFEIERVAAFDEKGERKLDAAKNPVFDETFKLNGVVLEDKPFRTLYQTVIGLLIDDERKKDIPSDPPVATITFHMRDGGGDYVATYHPYDRDFYAVDNNGLKNFIILRHRVDNMISELKAYAEANK